MESRTLTNEEVEWFGLEPMAVNWGIVKDGRIVACFQAQPDFQGWLNVHANIKRHSLHPVLTCSYAKLFSDRLLDLGANGLICGIHPKHKAAIKIAINAGFVESSRCLNLVILKRQNDGQ